MATANELLNNLSMTNSEDEGYIIIGSDRYITIPDSLKKIAVEHDHNIETVTFKCPRHWDEHDLSKLILYINYRLPNGEIGSYIAKNIKVVDDDSFTFTWTIRREVTKYKGNILFLVCAKSTELEGDEALEKLHWNTELCTDAYVSEGLEAEAPLEEEYPDIVTQLLERMTEVESIAVKKVEMDTLVAQATQASQQAFDSAENVENSAAEIRNSYANAIKGNVSGEIIRVDDVSPLEHTVNAVVRSKNLWPSIKSGSTATLAGVTLTRNTDGSISLNGTATSSTNFKVGDMYLPSGKYYLCDFADGEFPDNTFARSQIYSYDTLESLSVHNYRESNFVAGTDTILSEGTYECRIRIAEGVTYDATLYPTLFAEKYGYPTEYEPYIDPSTVEVTGCGKNLFNKYSYVTATGNLVENTQSGYSHTVRGAEGTSTNSYSSGVFTIVLPNVIPLKDTVTVSLYVTLQEQGVWSNAFRLWCVDRTITFVDYKTFNLTVGTRTKITATFTAPKSESLARLSFYTNNNKLLLELDTLQIETGDTATAIENYTDGVITSDENGVYTLTSVSPTMTIFTDTPGAIVDVTYNRDNVLIHNDMVSDIGNIETALDSIIAIQNQLIGGDA